MNDKNKEWRNIKSDTIIHHGNGNGNGKSKINKNNGSPIKTIK
jgi:hypothetical protein